jgi:hypothetical protein
MLCAIVVSWGQHIRRARLSRTLLRHTDVGPACVTRQASPAEVYSFLEGTGPWRQKHPNLRQWQFLAVVSLAW